MNYFQRHRISIIIMAVIIVLVIIGLIWFFRSQNAAKEQTLTKEQIQYLLQTGSATGSDTITGSEKAVLQKSGSATGTSTTLTEEEKQALINSGSAK